MKESELTTLSVLRKVYIESEEDKQIATVMHPADDENLFRTGSVILLNTGQLHPAMLQNFHNRNYIYPIGYKVVSTDTTLFNLNDRGYKFIHPPLQMIILKQSENPCLRAA